MVFETLASSLEFFAETTPHAPALLLCDGTAISYDRLWTATRSLNQEFSLGTPDRAIRIGLVHSGTGEFAALIAAFASFATVLPLPAILTEEEYGRALTLAEIDVVIVEPNIDTAIRDAARKRYFVNVSGDHHSQPQQIVTGFGTLDMYASATASQGSQDFSQPDDIAFLIPTSGTTADAKIAPISHRRLAARAESTAHVMALSAKDRTLNFMPLFHVGGLSAGLGATLFTGAAMAPAVPTNMDSLHATLAAVEPSIIVAGYAVCRSIAEWAERADYKAGVAATKLRMIRSGAGHLDQPVITRLIDRFDVPLLQVYGSTETSFIAFNRWESSSVEPCGLETYNGCIVQIVDPQGKDIAVGLRGEISVKGPGVIDFYDGLQGEPHPGFSNGWFRTGDEGFMDATGRLHITGRIKEIINRGGQKISPAEIDAILLRHPEIHEVATFPIIHPTMGEEVGAAIVLESQSSLSEQKIRHYADHRITPYRRPKVICLVPSIPVSPTGKIQRHKLAEQLDIKVPQQAGNIDPATDTEQVLQDLWADTLGLRPGLNNNFFMMGGDSLKSVALALAIEEKFGIHLPPVFVYGTSTIQSLAAAIDAGSYRNHLAQLRDSGQEIPLVFVHPIFGDVQVYWPLISRLDPDFPVYGVLASSDPEDDGVTTMEQLAEQYSHELSATFNKGPVILVGYSFGGYAAFEMAKKLRANGVAIPLLILLDSLLVPPETFLGWALRHIKSAKKLGLVDLFKYGLTRLFGNLRHMNRQIGKNLALGDQANKPPLVHYLRNLSNKYQPTPYDGDVLFIRARDSHTHRPTSWAHMTNGRYTEELVAGDHETMVHEIHVDALAEVFSRYLARYPNRRS